MKTLANCTPREFLVQTNKIRKQASDWLKKTRIFEIREKLPAYTESMTEEEREEAHRKQLGENINEFLDNALDTYPEETADLLGLVCFIDPADLDNYKMTDILKAITEIISDQAVLDFFTSLMRLGLTDISDTAKA
jgi:hypothetical protein